MQAFADETMNLQIEQAVQWALEDLLTNKKAPSQEDLAVIPQGELSTIIDALTKALTDAGETGVKRAFKALLKDHSWLSSLRNKPLPPRPGETNQTGEQTPEEEYAGTLLSDVTIKETEYLWFPRLPKGKKDIGMPESMLSYSSDATRDCRTVKRRCAKCHAYIRTYGKAGTD